MNTAYVGTEYGKKQHIRVGLALTLCGLVWRFEISSDAGLWETCQKCLKAAGRETP